MILVQSSTNRLTPARAGVEGDLSVRIPASAHTLDGFRRWIETVPDKAKAVFLAGEVVLDMSKEDIESHVKVKGEIFSALYQLNKSIDWGEIFQDGLLVTNDKADVGANPDAAGVRWQTLETGKAKIVEVDGKHLELNGSPDWILEVISPSSVTKDTRDLKKAYHAAEIREYWLVDARGDDVSFIIHHWHKSAYRPAAKKAGWQESKAFAHHFRLTRERGRRGLWRYTLHVK